MSIYIIPTLLCDLNEVSLPQKGKIVFHCTIYILYIIKDIEENIFRYEIRIHMYILYK